jgi:CheY-like chemotaxis protein
MGKVLVVDDQLELRTLFSRLLEKQGHSVVAVGNGNVALRTTETWVPDLVLLDMAMPEMDGLAFLRAIRSRAGWANVPVIMLSGLMSPGQVIAAQELGVADQLMKGRFSTRELRASVARCLLGNKSEANSAAA